MKVTAHRWPCRFFFVISVDASRRALGRGKSTFFGPEPRWSGVYVAKTSLFKIFGHFFSQTMTKWRESYRPSLALPVLFCDLGRCIKAGARAWQIHFFWSGTALVRNSKRHDEPFQDFWVIFLPKMTKRRKSYRPSLALPVLLCDLGRCTKAGARA